MSVLSAGFVQRLRRQQPGQERRQRPQTVLDRQDVECRAFTEFSECRRSISGTLTEVLCLLIR